MTHHFIPAALLVLTVCAYLRGLLGYLRYAKQRRFDLVDANYRTAVLIASAKHDLRIANLKRSVRRSAARVEECA
ncbi:hypothetical protein XarzCFBP7410_04290 [Xanthomonas arboricola pv. zantedeschiae]|uniref:hypothetical protein n=1 Tax=Xanthomonas arboricola TaxID=56448 RepID=UPI000CEDC017|nr:hypothetical protein [Xanthomonas arboricola]PPT86410.1 hypothetical protein XarzCFBP7410_04290 [Xanthomonas arboricola pv. zantedeschiae]